MQKYLQVCDQWNIYKETEDQNIFGYINPELSDIGARYINLRVINTQEVLTHGNGRDHPRRIEAAHLSRDTAGSQAGQWKRSLGPTDGTSSE